MFSNLCLLVLYFLAPILCFSSSCVIPPANTNFTSAGYDGFWYEIARIQTFGGAVFQTGCECTALNVSVSPELQYDLLVENQCRRFSPTAPVTVISGYLYNETAPGRFTETILSFVKPVAYNVIYLDENSSIEYDCGEDFLGLVNYCIHILSRSPVMSNGTLETLVSHAESLGLNTHKLPLHLTPQLGCW